MRRTDEGMLVEEGEERMLCVADVPAMITKVLTASAGSTSLSCLPLHLFLLLPLCNGIFDGSGREEWDGVYRSLAFGPLPVAYRLEAGRCRWVLLHRPQHEVAYSIRGALPSCLAVRCRLAECALEREPLLHALYADVEGHSHDGQVLPGMALDALSLDLADERFIAVRMDEDVLGLHLDVLLLRYDVDGEYMRGEELL